MTPTSTTQPVDRSILEIMPWLWRDVRSDGNVYGEFSDALRTEFHSTAARSLED
jgi:hypothetical protein